MQPIPPHPRPLPRRQHAIDALVAACLYALLDVTPEAPHLPRCDGCGRRAIQVDTGRWVCPRKAPFLDTWGRGER